MEASPENLGVRGYEREKITHVDSIDFGLITMERYAVLQMARLFAEEGLQIVSSDIQRSEKIVPVKRLERRVRKMNIRGMPSIMYNRVQRTNGSTSKDYDKNLPQGQLAQIVDTYVLIAQRPF